MRRRSFLAGITGAGTLAGLSTWRWLSVRPQDVVIGVLRKRLHYLQMDEAGLARFADDVVARDTISPLRLRALGAFMPFYRHLALSSREGWVWKVRHGEERIITVYLLSSDFFLHGAREDRAVHYLGYYDPIRNLAACSHPFARPVIPSSEAPPEKAPAAAWPAAAAATAATAAR
jgi:hypothetical protein